jgi:hypothetical protein
LAGSPNVTYAPPEPRSRPLPAAARTEACESPDRAGFFGGAVLALGVGLALSSGVGLALADGAALGLEGGVAGCSAVGSAVGSGVGTAVGSGVGAAVGSGVGAAVGSGVGSGGGCVEGSALGGALDAALRSAAAAGIAMTREDTRRTVCSATSSRLAVRSPRLVGLGNGVPPQGLRLPTCPRWLAPLRVVTSGVRVQ